MYVCTYLNVTGNIKAKYMEVHSVNVGPSLEAYP